MLRIIITIQFNTLSIIVSYGIALHTLFYLSLQYSCKIGIFIIILNLEIRKLRHRETEFLVQSHIVYV